MHLSPYLLLFVLSTFIAGFAQVLLKKGAMRKYPNVIREYLNPFVISGYGLMFIGMLIAIIGYRFVEYKNGPVMESVGFIFVMVLGRLFFGEKITWKKILGNILILGGIAVFYLA